MAILAIIAGLVGGFALAIAYQSADAYQSPSSAAAQIGLQNHVPTVFPVTTTPMDQAFIHSGQGMSANIGLDTTTGSTSISLSNLNIKMNRPFLEGLYQVVFHRDLDDGAMVHIGKSLPVVVHDIIQSPEAQRYGALAVAVKSYENARRMPGTMSDADRQSRMTAINDALASLLAWVDTLPKQDATAISPPPSADPSPISSASPSPTSSPSPTL